MYFVIKYPPTRSSFPGDATAQEKEIMAMHIEYWTNLMAQGYCRVFGPVMDPQGVYGLGIVQVDNEDQVRAFMDGDPAIQAGLMKPKFYPMGAVVQKG